MGIEWIGRSVWRWAGSARRSTTDDMGRGTVVGEASFLTVDDWEKHEEEIYCPRRRRSTAGAETPERFVMLIVLSRGGRDRKRWRAELDFGGSEPFDDHHGGQHIEDSTKDLSHHRGLKSPGRSAALTSKGVTDNRAATTWCGGGWPGSRNYEYARTSWGTGAAGSGARTHRAIASSAFVCCGERSRASGK